MRYALPHATAMVIEQVAALSEMWIAATTALSAPGPVSSFA